MWNKFKLRCKSLILTTTSLSTATTPPTTITAPKSPTSIIVLNTRWSSNVPVITDSTGKAKYAGEDFDFDFGEETEVFDSCSVTYRGDLYIFGGYDQWNQISKVMDCSLKRVGSLSFNFYHGGCAAVNEERSYLCFSSNDMKQCHEGADPLGAFSKTTKSQFDHRSIRIAASEGYF